MKTDIYCFEKNAASLDDITDAAARISAYNHLTKDQELELTLLSEELTEMMPNLLRYGDGKFWIENKGENYEIHVVVEPDDLLPSGDRERILSVSTTGENAAAKGIMNKIRIAADILIANYSVSVSTTGMPYPDSTIYNMGAVSDTLGYSTAWSLENYRKEASADTEAWDELEKSIVAKMADDVIVGIIGGKVEVTIKKSFKK